MNLEELIRNKQDALRGRPLNWTDDFKDWRISVDWVSVAIFFCGVACLASAVVQFVALLYANPS